jgi:hypothetical protein
VTSAQKSLSFIVFGVPRSGTKGLARALNLHPNVLCAQERFDYTVDHSQVSFPAAFLDKPRAMDRLDWRKLHGLEAEAARKGQIRFVGNKLPRYYLALDRINSEVADLRNLLIYRSPYGFIPSWNLKEREQTETRWHAGEVGLFGLLELLVCLQNAIRQTELFVFPYTLGLNESTEPILSAVDFLGADPQAFELETFVTKHLPKKAVSRKRLPLQPFERELLEKLNVKELDQLIGAEWGRMTAHTAVELGDYLESITAVLPQAIDEAFIECDNSAALSYGARYTRSNRAELAELLRMTAGSEFMADVQRFGVWRKLVYAYFQRSLVKRRLTGLRRTEP